MNVTGHLTPTEHGADLTLQRTLAMPVAEAWAWLTASPRTAAWFGSWEGEGRAGGTVEVTMAFEGDGPPMRMRVTACEAPHRFEIASDGDFAWNLEIGVSAAGADALVTFTHHLEGSQVDGIGEIGPGWEYYLDQLVAATQDAPRRSFDVYYPALRDAYTALRSSSDT